MWPRGAQVRPRGRAQPGRRPRHEPGLGRRGPHPAAATWRAIPSNPRARDAGLGAGGQRRSRRRARGAARAWPPTRRRQPTSATTAARWSVPPNYPGARDEYTDALRAGGEGSRGDGRHLGVADAIAHDARAGRRVLGAQRLAGERAAAAGRRGAAVRPAPRRCRWSPGTTNRAAASRRRRGSVTGLGTAVQLAARGGASLIVGGDVRYSSADVSGKSPRAARGGQRSPGLARRRAGRGRRPAGLVHADQRARRLQRTVERVAHHHPGGRHHRA